MPQNVLTTRDYKKVYARPDGHAPVMGETLAPEFPLKPDLRLDDPHGTLERFVEQIMSELEAKCRDSS
jgi:adenylylsulfate kinase-like enzyme